MGFLEEELSLLRSKLEESIDERLAADEEIARLQASLKECEDQLETVLEDCTCRLQDI
jgi:predicted nuclease with TOPRIM domain